MTAPDDPAARLARLLAAEAALACSSLAGAVLVAAAACVAGDDLAAVLRLPDAGGRERRVVLPRRQVRALDGVPVLQLLRLAGAEPVEVGTARACGADELAALLAAGAAAGLCLPGAASGDGLPGFAWACRAAGVPALVVCGEGGGPAPLAALDAGADLALAGTGFLPGAPGAGLILGRVDLVRRCALQGRGLGALVAADAATLGAVLAAAATAAVDPASGLALADPIWAAGPAEPPKAALSPPGTAEPRPEPPAPSS